MYINSRYLVFAFFNTSSIFFSILVPLKIPDKAQDINTTKEAFHIERIPPANVSINSILEMESIEAIKQYVISGFGISFLPQIAVEKELESGELVEIKYKGPKFYSSAQILYHKDKWLSPALQAILDMVEESKIEN